MKKINTKLNKLFCAAVTLLCIMAFVVAPSEAAPKKEAIHIYAAFPGATFDETGTFVATGALNISGKVTMHVEANGMTDHCVVTLTPDDGSGTITIHQQCQFATNPIKGRWQIVSGTGDYADLKGNGSLLMPGNDEDMTGFIY